jgi:predicted aminopeptidase
LDAVKKVIRSYRKAATRALLSEDRELLMAVEQARRSKLLQKRGKAAELDNLRQIGQ